MKYLILITIMLFVSRSALAGADNFSSFDPKLGVDEHPLPIEGQLDAPVTKDPPPPQIVYDNTPQDSKDSRKYKNPLRVGHKNKKAKKLKAHHQKSSKGERKLAKVSSKKSKKGRWVCSPEGA